MLERFNSWNSWIQFLWVSLSKQEISEVGWRYCCDLFLVFIEKVNIVKFPTWDNISFFKINSKDFHMDVMHRHHTHWEISKLSSVCNHFLKSIFKNCFNWMKPVGISEDHPSLNFLDWCYRFRKKPTWQSMFKCSSQHTVARPAQQECEFLHFSQVYIHRFTVPQVLLDELFVCHEWIYNKGSN